MGLYPRAITEYLSSLAIPRGPNSNIYLVDPANGNDNALGDRWTKPLATIGEALDRCTANQHDVVLYLAGASGITLSEALEWDKNYTHLIGMCAPTNVAQRARIFQEDDDLDLAPLVDISASGCIFQNLYIFQGPDDADSNINVSVSGGRNYFRNVHFAGGGHDSVAVDGGASLLLDGAEECLFERCTVGLDTVAAATGFVNLLVDGDAKRCIFDDCLFSLYSGHAGAAFVEVVDSAGFDRYLLFRRCLFLNSSSEGAKFPAGAFVIPAGMGSVTHRIVLQDCAILGASEIEANNRGIVYLNMGAITAGGNSGLMQVSNTT